MTSHSFPASTSAPFGDYQPLNLDQYLFPVVPSSATTTPSTACTSYFQSSSSSASYHGTPSPNQNQTLQLPSTSNPLLSSSHSAPPPPYSLQASSLSPVTPPSTPGQHSKSPSAGDRHSPGYSNSIQAPGPSARPLYSHQDQAHFFRDVPSTHAGGSQGPFILQKMYRPHTHSDRRRYVEEVGLEEPILFWADHPSELGIPLSDVLHSKVKRLLYRDETVFEGRGPSVSIRLEVSLPT
jgi:hypothetical protein